MDDKINELAQAAKQYKNADQNLENACGQVYDPIACTVFSLKGIYLDQIPEESKSAGYWLSETVRLNKELIDAGMDPDDVRQIWLNILDN